MLALKATLGLTWPACLKAAAPLGIGAQWLGALQRLWVIEQARAPALVGGVLRNGQPPSLDALRTIAGDLFPAEVLENIRNVGVVLTGASRGLDTLLLRNRSIAEVSVFHGDSRGTRSPAHHLRRAVAL